MKRVVQFTIHIPEEVDDDFEEWLKQHPNLYLMAKVGCTEHGWALFLVRPKDVRELTVVESKCLMIGIGQMIAGGIR